MSKRHHCEVTPLSCGNNILTETADDINGLKIKRLADMEM